MIQINASVRLTAAKADPKDAKAYLKSLGLKVGTAAHSDEDYILFPLKNVGDAIDKLTKQFGKIVKEYQTPNGIVVQRVWKVPGKGFINVCGAIQSDAGAVSLMNNAKPVKKGSR